MGRYPIDMILGFALPTNLLRELGLRIPSSSSIVVRDIETNISIVGTEFNSFNVIDQDVIISPLELQSANEKFYSEISRLGYRPLEIMAMTSTPVLVGLECDGTQSLIHL